MKMLRKNVYSKSLKNSQENVFDGVYFSKVASLQFIDCNSTVNRLHHRFSLEYVPETKLLKKNIWRKESVVYERFNKVATL